MESLHLLLQSSHSSAACTEHACIVCRSAAGLYVLQCLPYTLGPSTLLGSISLFAAGLVVGVLCLLAVGVRSRPGHRASPQGIALLAHHLLKAASLRKTASQLPTLRHQAGSAATAN